MTYQEACKILEIQPNASIYEIKKAYKQKVKKYHPDIYQGDKEFAEEKIKKINEAYSILSKSHPYNYNTTKDQSADTTFDEEFIRIYKEWVDKMIEKEVKQTKKMVKMFNFLLFFMLSTLLLGLGLMLFIGIILSEPILPIIIIAVSLCIIFIFIYKKIFSLINKD